MTATEPTPEQLTRFAGAPDTGPVVMINLLQYRQPDGRASYGTYSQAVVPFLLGVGGRVLYYGDSVEGLIGDEESWWDTIVVVEYPSRAAFLQMVANPDYQAIHVHRADALERAELIATSGIGVDPAQAEVLSGGPAAG